MKSKVYTTLGLIILFYFQLLFSDNRILLKEVRVKPGDSYFVEEYGNLGEKQKQDCLVCYYFNGRKILAKVFWYAPNNIMGKDSCRFFVYKEEEK